MSIRTIVGGIFLLAGSGVMLLVALNCMPMIQLLRTGRRAPGVLVGYRPFETSSIKMEGRSKQGAGGFTTTKQAWAVIEFKTETGETREFACKASLTAKIGDEVIILHDPLRLNIAIVDSKETYIPALAGMAIGLVALLIGLYGVIR